MKLVVFEVAVRFIPTQRYKRSVLAIVIAAEVLQLRLIFVTVVLRAVVPVAVQNCTPVGPFRNSFARGVIVPALAVFRM